MLESRIDLAFFTLGGLVALFVMLKPDRTIRLLSYRRARISDIPPWRVTSLRITAAICLIGSVVRVAQDLWSMP